MTKTQTNPLARSTNPAQHFILTRNGETIHTDKIGAKAGFAAYARMMHRMADAAGVKYLSPIDETGERFQDGLALEGPFQKL